jgi:ornithine cyclodeaminase/alanine dehydrogenase-like protein (mu-crystallin family)
VQGRGHVRAFAHALGLEQVRLWGRDPAATKRAAAALDQEVGPRVLAAAAVAEALAGADVVATCTSSSTPLVEADQLAPGATVISIGSITPDRGEVGLSVVATAATVVVDHPPAALEHAGPVIQALAAGLLHETDLVGLGEVVTGRQTPDGKPRTTWSSTTALALACRTRPPPGQSSSEPRGSAWARGLRCDPTGG